MATTLSLSEPIIIVGGGTFGTSTAYHLVKKGYKFVTVLDRWAPPSTESAGNDYNKIVRSEYTGDIHTILAEEAKTAWKQNPLFDGIYNESGWILAATHSAMPYLNECRKTQQAVGLQPPQELLPADVRRRWPMLSGPLREWKPYYNANTA
jgi:sarcosine oxidase / L-pipecolate oxidase